MSKYQVRFYSANSNSYYSYFVKYDNIDNVASYTYKLHKHILGKLNLAEICIRKIK